MLTGADGGLFRQQVASGFRWENTYTPARGIELFAGRVVELNPAASFSAAVDLVDDEVPGGWCRIVFRLLAFFPFNEVEEGRDAEIRAVQAGVVALDGENVFSFSQDAQVSKAELFSRSRLVVDDGRAVKLNGIEVGPGHLLSIDIGNEAVVIIGRQDGGLHQVKVVDLKAVPEKYGQVIARHVIKDSGIVVIPVAEPCRAGFPAAVVEVVCLPVLRRRLGASEVAEFGAPLNPGGAVGLGGVAVDDSHRVLPGGGAPYRGRGGPAARVGFFQCRGDALERGPESIGGLRPEVRFSVVDEGHHVAQWRPELQELAGIVEVAGEVAVEGVSWEVIAGGQQVRIGSDDKEAPGLHDASLWEHIGDRTAEEPSADVYIS